MQADAFAKVNLVLQVRAADRSGMHPIRSLAHSIDWHDDVELSSADEDLFTVEGSEDVPGDASNLAVRALEAVREHTGRRDPVELVLRKRIPAAAGLGGGSADAAAGLALAARLYRAGQEELPRLGAALGADVPFCLLGGAAWAEGYGERLEPVLPSEDFAAAVVVPPMALSTAAVYRRWDDLGGPQGPSLERRHVPDSLRDHAPLVNDLVPAAVDLAPELGEWMADVSRRWGVPVVMSGSGPAFYGFFGGLDEAGQAAGAVDGLRAARACRPMPVGRRERLGGTLA